MDEPEKDKAVRAARESMEDTEDEFERPSLDTRRHDQETLTGEEEAERLLAGDKNNKTGSLAGLFRSSNSQSTGSRARRKGRWRSDEGGGSELLYKAEEGGPASSSESLVSSSEDDKTRLSAVYASRKKKRSNCCKYAAIHVMIVVAFLALLYGAYIASGQGPSKKAYIANELSNGTHMFPPTTILISLDGFRADFVHRGLTPHISSLIKQGVSPEYMLPSFPSLTFPNHFTLVTGMYPESHGIVGNTFWDPHMQEEFYYTDPARSMRPEFWNAEPLWETAELQGVPAAIHMWPGSEAHIGGKELDPAYIDKFNGNEVLDVKVNRILEWLDIPGQKDEGASTKSPRPQLIAAYVPNVDADGHLYGPNSTYIRSTITEVDGMLGSLFEGMEARNLTDIVNVVVVSDHGMATTSTDRLIQLDDLVDPNLIEHIDGWPLYGLRPKDQSPEHLMSLYLQILTKSQSSEYKDNFDVYLRDQNMPARYHFSQNDRIAPLWLVPRPGWAIVKTSEFDVKAALANGDTYHPRGLHGYDHEHPLMRAIFIARGPAFPHPKGSRLEPFQNIELYNIVCDSLGLEPRPNNGTLRLPLRTIGLHDLDAQGEEYVDMPDTGAVLLPPDLSGLGSLPPPPGSPPNEVDTLGDGAPAPAPTETRPVVVDGGDESEHDRTWLEWINQKLQDAKVWATGLFGSDKDKDATKTGDTK